MIPVDLPPKIWLPPKPAIIRAASLPETRFPAMVPGFMPMFNPGGGGIGGIDAFTMLMLHGEGANGSTTAVDSSSYNRTSTALGNAQISTARSKFGASSMLFDGTGDAFTFPASPDWAFPGDFTIDGWAWKSANGPDGYDSFCATDQTGSAATQFFFEVSSTRGMVFRGQGTSVSQSSGTTNPNDSAWHHYAVVRFGSTATLYRDGVSVGSATLSASITNSGALHIGKSSVYEFNGHIDGFRVSKGVARWTANFTPPAGPYTT